MINELERLAGCRELFDLLSHYAALAGPDRQSWQDRRMELPGCQPRDLTRLHGELIAYGWLEQNTGVVPPVRSHPVPACYRVTTQALRALKQVEAGEVD